MGQVIRAKAHPPDGVAHDRLAGFVPPGVPPVPLAGG